MDLLGWFCSPIVYDTMHYTADAIDMDACAAVIGRIGRAHLSTGKCLYS